VSKTYERTVLEFRKDVIDMAWPEEEAIRSKGFLDAADPGFCDDFLSIRIKILLQTS